MFKIKNYIALLLCFAMLLTPFTKAYAEEKVPPTSDAEEVIDNAENDVDELTITSEGEGEPILDVSPPVENTPTAPEPPATEDPHTTTTIDPETGPEIMTVTFSGKQIGDIASITLILKGTTHQKKYLVELTRTNGYSSTKEVVADTYTVEFESESSAKSYTIETDTVEISSQKGYAYTLSVAEKEENWFLSFLKKNAFILIALAIAGIGYFIVVSKKNKK